MGIRTAGTHLRPDHAIGGVCIFDDRILADRLGERRPAAAGIVLVHRSEQRLAADDVDIQTLLKELIIFTGKSPFRRRVLRHLISYTPERPSFAKSELSHLHSNPSHNLPLSKSLTQPCCISI